MPPREDNLRPIARDTSDFADLRKGGCISMEDPAYAAILGYTE